MSSMDIKIKSLKFMCKTVASVTKIKEYQRVGTICRAVKSGNIMEIDVNLRFTLIYIWTNARIARKMFMVQQNVAIMFIYAQTFVQLVMYLRYVCDR